MANWKFDPRISATSTDPAVRQLQQIVMDLARALKVAFRELDEDNMAPEFLASVQNKADVGVQVIKDKEPNVYMGNDGVIFKILE